MLKYKRKYGIFLFSALVLAIGFSPIASAHYNGDHIDFTTSGDYFVLDLIPTPVEESIRVMTNSSGQQFFVETSYTEGENGTTTLIQTYVGGNQGSTASISSGTAWSVTVKLPYIGDVLSKTEFLNYVANTDYVSISFEFDMDINQSTETVSSRSGDIVPDTVAPTNGAAFVVSQSIGTFNRYTWFYSVDNGEFPVDSLLDKLLSGTVPSVDGDVPFVIPFKAAGQVGVNNSFVAELGVFSITNNPNGALLPDPDDTTIIVDGLDNLGDAIDTSISAGVAEIESVVLQQTNDITGAVESQTEAILNYRSDVDMSISENAEVATKLAEESLINQQIYDGYNELSYDKDLGNDLVNGYFSFGVEMSANLVEMILDYTGIGSFVVITLTIGTALFILGRSLR